MPYIYKRIPNQSAEQVCNVLGRSGFIDTVKGARLLRFHDLDFSFAAVLDNLIMHCRSELASLQDHILPNTGMSLNNFLSWFILSPFGRTVCAMYERPKMEHSVYVDTLEKYYLRVKTESGKPIIMPGWNADMEVFMKRVTCLILLQLIKEHGRSEFYLHSENGERSAWFDQRTLDKLHAFGDETIGEMQFFKEINSVNFLFTPNGFYQEMMEYAGVLINTRLK